jgi:serine/threonine-protein kinase
MLSTTHFDVTHTYNLNGDNHDRCPDELVQRYHSILTEKRLNWTTHHNLKRLLGEGGQGVVYLTNRRGADGFTLPIALKIYFHAAAL